jgi:predicted transposase YbfD/YdcC
VTDEIATLAQRLGITDSQLAKLRVKHKSDKALLTWLNAQWSQCRDRTYLLSRRSVPPYTESPSEAMTGDVGESPPPDEIASYRMSREAKRRSEDEAMEEVGRLLSIFQDLRAAFADLPPKHKQIAGREIWLCREKMNAVERKIRRDIAA